MIDTKALREKVLDLAIRGKLVPQDPNDEPASVLLEQIREQKKQMVKEGKLKAKDIKDDSVIFVGDDNLHYEKFADGSMKCIEDELPFELPSSWLWTRLGTLSSAIQYGLSNSAEQDGTHRLLRITDIQDGRVNWDSVPFTTVNDSENYLLSTGDIVFARTGATVGKSFLIEETPYPSVYASYLIRIRLLNDIISEYIYQFFNSECYWEQITDKSVGVGQPNVNGTSLKNLLVPLAPMDEQKRIVSASRSTLKIVSKIDKNNNELLSTISSLKSKILDLAIRGKLVPQDPNDEPASVLLERIRAQKEELIKAGKIKRDKKESVIFKGEDNSYYENLPKNWSICTLGDISEIITGGTPSKSNKDYYNGSFPFFKPADLEQGVNTIIPSEYLSDEGKNVSRVIPAQSTLICCIGTIGKSGFVRCECATNQQINAVIPHIEPKYIYYFCNSQFFINELQRNATATTVAIINKSKTAETPFLLPPIAEQKRIVAAIEITFAQLDEIAKSIS